MTRPLRGRSIHPARPARRSTLLRVAMLGGVLTAIALMAFAVWAARTAPDRSHTNTAQRRPEWLDVPITDARTNAPIRLADFAGKTVVVESMAIGCAPCYAQQLESKQALAQLSPDRVVYVSLNMLPGTSAAQLKQYADENQFSWMFATDTEQIAPTLQQHFGITILNVDAVPMFFISPRGAVSALHTGGIAAGDLVRLIQGQGDQ
jgi:hypothetical protein